MAFIQLCLLFILAICCISLVDTRGLGGEVNCSSLAANNPVIRIKPGFSVAAVAKCKGGNRKFTDYGKEGYSLTGYFTGSKPGCKWQRKKSFKNKVVYELVVHLKTRRVGGKRHAMKKTFTCTFPYRGGSMSTSPPTPDKGNPFMPPKGMMAMFGKLPNADLVHFKVDTTSQTKQKYSYQARFRLRKKHKKWCGPAPYVTNASRSSTRAKSYKRIVYRCRPGFVPYRGITMIKCKPNRRYSKPTPRCVKATPLSPKRSSRRSCGRTPSVRNSISGSGKPIKANQSVRYMCKKGYRLFMGISSIKCRPNGRFTRKPICDKVSPRSCGRSPRVANSVSGSRRLSRFNRVVKYKCRRGYRFYKNKSTIKCQSNGKFTTPPRCVRAKGSRSCGRSPRVRNSVSGSRRRTRTNQVVRYRCRRGYKFLRGRSSIKCLKNGKFTPKPKCVKVRTCGNTPVVANSLSSRSRKSKVNKVYRYKCKPGYKFYMGRSSIKCRSNGKFTPKPICDKVYPRSCGWTPTVYKSVSGGRKLSKYNQVIKYACKKGYKLYKNRSTIKCLSSGKFTARPQCVRDAKTCGKTPKVRNSVSARVQSKVNKVYRYKCKPGYKFYMGISSIKCQSNGRFTRRPFCDKVSPRSCGRSPRVANSVSGSRRLSRFNRVVKYKCRRGYRFYKNKSTIKCQSNGKFTTPPRCVRAKGSRSCGRSPRVRNSVSGSRRRTRTNQVVRYRCRRGYKFLRGRSSIKCLKNGKFTPKPKCVKVAVKTCGKTPTVANSLSARVQSKVNKVYRYKCKPGYKFLMGRSTIKCRSSGKFTRKPRCVKGRSRSCGRSPRVANSVSGSRRLSRFNRVVKYKCRRGYRFYKNKSTIKCQSNGKFTTPPRCVRVTSCGKSPAVSNSVSGSGRKSRIYQVIRYKCKRGYRFLWEISAIWCRPDGRFSFKPRCIKVDGNRGSD